VTRRVVSLMAFLRYRLAPYRLPTLSLHDALPISYRAASVNERFLVRKGIYEPNSRCFVSSDSRHRRGLRRRRCQAVDYAAGFRRSEEHTSELQSHLNLVCRLLLEHKQHNTTT